VEKVLVIGATGFIGSYVTNLLISKGFEVYTTYKNNQRIINSKVKEHIKFDLDQPLLSIKNLPRAKYVILLAWEGLPDFKSQIHISKNLPNSYNVIDLLIKHGYSNITITGTCLEYGLINGELSVDQITNPITTYGIAKDALRKAIFSSFVNHVTIKWCRLFYVYGDGQSEKSLLPQLYKSIEKGENVFNMSKGDQLRDFIHVSKVAERLSEVMMVNYSKIYNLGTGFPISVRAFIETELERLKCKIDLNLGYYNYPDYEPMAFWAKNET
jgi:dTDP-6-deoxy-L-talose 4-dehydrogenase (NAD+)